MPEPPAGDVRVGVATLVTRGDRVLLLRRRGAHGAGTWSTPGGHLEHGESIPACAARETLEETGLVVTGLRFVAVTNDVFPELRRHYITIWMKAMHVEGEPSLAAPYEADALDWFAWEDLPQPLFLPLQHLLDRDCLPPDGFPGT